MKTTKIVLAEKEYTIQRMPAMRAIAWRKRAQELLDRFPDLANAYQQETDNIVTAGLDLYSKASGLVEALVEVVLDTDATVRADKDFILENAFDDDFLEAFQRALLLNAPLQGMAQAT